MNQLEAAPEQVTLDLPKSGAGFEITQEDARLLPHVAQCLRAQKPVLAQQLMLAIYETGSTLPVRRADFAALEDWKQETLNTVVDLAAAWFAQNTDLTGQLLAGWLHSQLEPMGLHDLSAGPVNASHVVTRTGVLWADALKTQLSEPESQAMVRRLNQVSDQLAMPERRSLRVLYVGDCLLPEIMTSLTGLCVEGQIRLTHTFLHEHVAPVLRNQIRALRGEKYDLVFFSPFTHTFSAEYAQLLSWRAATWNRTKFMTVVEDMLGQVQDTATTLHEVFDCPIYIHNAACVVQSFSFWSGLGKNLIAQRNRKTLRALIHQRIERMVKDARFDEQLRLLNEQALLQRTSAYELGKVFFHGVIFHPTRIGVELARTQYFDAVYSAAYLSTKKVVVCDLDNTLWDGVIGEGSVTPHNGRQHILKELRNRGVLLSINSKNDPANVHFTGSLLQMDDFVAAQINWQHKTANMAKILQELNLKVKDFVFLDDRPDELARMQQVFPEMVVLNAEDERTWRRMAHWQTHLANRPDEGDRTQQYHERQAREHFVATLSESKSSEEDDAQALIDLQISVKLQPVAKSGLKRVVELINRTNQFNLCGTRTSIRDLEVGLGAQHWVFTVSAKDKFGDMGVVGAMKVERDADGLTIPIFVLSCRVFGLGIEYALLNTVRELGSTQTELTGEYQETPSNKPSRELYPRSGFVWTGTKWTGHMSTLPPDPAWLAIDRVPIQRAS